MYLKYLKIENNEGLVRRIDFRLGLNLIVDKTPRNTTDTGNNVGKTTMLRLIDFCLGGKAADIYATSDNVKNKLVKRFLEETEVTVELSLCESLSKSDGRNVTIRKNFLTGKKSISQINGQNVNKNIFQQTLQMTIWNMKTEKPSFKEIISHSLRINDDRLQQPLRTITHYQPDIVYEALHMFLFGANIDNSERRIELENAIKNDRKYVKRLEGDATKSELRQKKMMIKEQIEHLEFQKNSLILNPDFEKDLECLTNVKRELRVQGIQLNNLKLRESLVIDAANDIERNLEMSNMESVANIYKQAHAYIEKIDHTYNELVSFHREMKAREKEFITLELPKLRLRIDDSEERIKELRKQERDLEEKLNLSANMTTFDELITNLNNCYKEEGSLEQRISQIETVENSIKQKEGQLKAIDEDLFSEKREKIVQEQLDKFNSHFSSVSKRLYNESYEIIKEIKISKDNKPHYKFSPLAADNFSTGKKQGEVTCFDLAYISFADEEDIPCLHFILHDKMELLDDNQLLSIGSLTEEQGNVQLVASILQDKLPQDLTAKKYIILELTQNDRLFRIEDSTWYKELDIR